MSFTIGGGVNLEKCYTNLLSADTNNDGFLSQAEFLPYLQTSAPNGLLETNQYGSALTSFNMLPQTFVGIYNFFACGDPYVGCPSVIGIDISGLLQSGSGSGSGSGAGEMLSEQETTFLYRLCKDTEETVEEYESSVGSTTTSDPTKRPTEKPTTSVPTPSPSAVVITTPAPTPPPTSGTVTTCPPQYAAGQTYAADDLVSNDIYESTATPYFKCKPFPFTAWCSQAAYEPGVTIAWEQAWELMGVCDDDDNSGSTTVATTATVATTTAGATTVTAPTSDGSTTTVATTPSFSTPATPTPPEITPTRQPTVKNPEESPTSGPLPVQFQYEIGNNLNLQTQSILTESNPENDMMGYLESGTDDFVQLIMTNTFGDRLSSFAGAVSKNSVKMNNENVRRRTTKTTTRQRNLAVSYNTTSVSIQNIQDIACSHDGMITESRCQKVTVGVTLQLLDEPPLTTNLRFQTGISRGIDMGLLTFPPESGIAYVGQTKSVQVFPELGSRAPNGIDGGNNNSGGGGSDGTSNNNWVVPVSVTVAASVAAILILFAGSRFRKRQREGKEFDGAEEVSLEGDGNDVENDLSPNYYSTGSKRHMNIFEETIEETPNFNDDDDDGSDLIDLERGTTMNHSNSDQRRSSKNPFSSSSSSGSSSSSSSSSDEEMYKHQPVSKGYPLPSWKEVSEEDLSKSGDLGEMYMRDHGSTDYRAGVEALVRQACPEHIDNVDDMMAEYEGREAVLVGQLSVMLAAQREGGQGEGFSTENKETSNESRLRAVPESGAVLADPRSFDESSAAGSSQWSTDDGMSSIDASMSASSSEKEMLPDTYAAIGDAAITIEKTTTFIKVDKDPGDEFSDLEIPAGGQEITPARPITREDLDAAIEAGDWNAVGATASLLAGRSFERADSESGHSMQSDSDRSESVSLSSMDCSDQDRALEFEKLIEAGDWKAVMAIASEFEGAGESGSFNVSKLSDMEYDNSRRLSSSDILEHDNQVSTKRQEIEELVRRVVPDEIENLDEMLLQFKGRENELIMTLQTMDERNQNSSNSNSSISSPASSKASSAGSPYQTLKQMPSFHEETVFESDSVRNESDDDAETRSSNS